MKIKEFKSIAMAIGMMAGMGFSAMAGAVQVTGALGASSAAADAYTFVCTTGTTQARIRVSDTRTIVNLSATVFATFGEDASPTLSVADTESTTTSSPWATNTSDLIGTYAVVVNKSTTGTEDYILEAQCLSSSGAIIGPSRLVLQTNQ